MVHVTYAWYIRGSAITFQINSCLSINIAYTSPQLHNKLYNLQKSKIQECLLENPYFYLRKTPNPSGKGTKLKVNTLLMNSRAIVITSVIRSHEYILSSRTNTPSS